MLLWLRSGGRVIVAAEGGRSRSSQIGSVKLFDQLSFQMATRCLLDGPPLSGDCFFLRDALSSRPSFDRLRQMRNFRTEATDFFFLGLCVGIHEKTLTLLIRDKKNRNGDDLKND
jgi:hypothetical protein